MDLKLKNYKELQLLIVTGYSGAGKTTVLRALEDLGFYCTDNLPIGFLPSFFNFIVEKTEELNKFALGIDVRSGQEMDSLVGYLDSFKDSRLKIKIIFLTASTNILLKRFQETRRKHPLIDPLDLQDAIALEKDILKPLHNIAHIKFNTDQCNIHDLRLLVKSAFVDTTIKMVVTITSFGFKYGIPLESNFIYDLRSLINPYFIDGLKDLDGTDQKIKDFFYDNPEIIEYKKVLSNFILFTIEKAYKEGRYYINISLGCTGGRHRSVFFAQELAMLDIDYVQFIVKHRDINKDILNTNGIIGEAVQKNSI